MRVGTIAGGVLLGAAVVLGSAVANLPSPSVPAIIQGPFVPEPVLHLALGAAILPMARSAEDPDMWTREDGRDQPVRWMDIVDVRWRPVGQMHFGVEFGGLVPKVEELDRAGTTFSYGLVFETTGDGVADYEVGLSSDAREPGDLRVWVTNLATGETEQQVGPPYGHPVEFGSPMERGDGGRSRGAMFTFLGGSLPPGLSGQSRFYAWSTLAEGGNAVRRDFAPDAAWLAIPPEPSP